MGEQTVQLVSYDHNHYEVGVRNDLATLRDALEQWLQGVQAKQPQLENVAELRELIRLDQSNDSDYADFYYRVETLASRRQSNAVPAAATVGELIEQLKGLDPSLPVKVVAAEHSGYLNAIEVTRLG